MVTERTEIKTIDLLAELEGETCRCGKRKVPMQTFCGNCYYKLPPSKRRALYNRIGDGYEEAYAAACAFFDEAKAS